MRARIVRLGLFVAVTSALSIYIGATIAHVDLASTYAVSASFSDVTGLNGGDPVKIAGVPVGQVSSITLLHGRADVVLQVDRSVRIPVAGTEVVVRWQNLIGQRYVSIDPGPPPGGSRGYIRTDGFGYIAHTQPAVDIGAVLGAIGPLAQAVDPQELNQIFTAVSQALQGNDSAVASMVSNLASVGSTLASRDQTITRMLADYQSLAGVLATRNGEISTMVGDIQQLSASFADNTQLLGAAIDSVSGASTNLNQLLAADQQQLSGFIDNLAGVAQLVTNKLPQLEQGFSGLPATFAALFSTGAYGNYLRVDDTCLQFQPAPCTLFGGYSVP